MMIITIYLTIPCFDLLGLLELVEIVVPVMRFFLKFDDAKLRNIGWPAVDRQGENDSSASEIFSP